MRRTSRKPTLAVTVCGGCSRLWCLIIKHMHRSRRLRNWSSELWREFYKSCLLDNVCDMILSSKVYPAFFDRSERTLNTHARLDELLHERNMTLGLCPRIAQLFVPHILYHLACSLMAYISYSNSRYFLRQEKCKLIGNEFASISIQVGRIRWIKSCWENESTPRERIGAGQVNGCPKPATSMRHISGK